MSAVVECTFQEAKNKVNMGLEVSKKKREGRIEAAEQSVHKFRNRSDSDSTKYRDNWDKIFG